MEEKDGIKNLTEKIVAFRDEREWKQFHKPKDMALSLILEAAELLEHFQWKSESEVDEFLKNEKKELEDELSDVLYWVLLMAHDLDIDIVKASESKLEENIKKYPIEKARGNSKKYNKL